MTKSRLAGFTGYVRTLDAFARVFARLRAEDIVARDGGRDQVAITQIPRGCLDSLTRFQRDRYRELTGSYTEVL